MTRDAWVLLPLVVLAASPGCQGATGQTGAPGATGATGAVGPTGPAATIVIASAGGSIDAVGTDLQFLGPTASVTVTDPSQSVQVTAHGSFSADTDGASGLYLNVCYQDASGGDVTRIREPPDMDVTLPPLQRSVFGANGVATGLPAGTYAVGLCGRYVGTDPSPWLPDQAWVSAIRN